MAKVVRLVGLGSVSSGSSGSGSNNSSDSVSSSNSDNVSGSSIVGIGLTCLLMDATVVADTRAYEYRYSGTTVLVLLCDSTVLV